VSESVATDLLLWPEEKARKLLGEAEAIALQVIKVGWAGPPAVPEWMESTPMVTKSKLNLAEEGVHLWDVPTLSQAREICEGWAGKASLVGIRTCKPVLEVLERWRQGTIFDEYTEGYEDAFTDDTDKAPPTPPTPPTTKRWFKFFGKSNEQSQTQAAASKLQEPTAAAFELPPELLDTKARGTVKQVLSLHAEAEGYLSDMFPQES
jgi:hypothetical protein